jgi:succinate dehydrogenase / fumarate reductase cytochrome b subunit
MTELGQARPLSPHVQVWRWHVTMLASILHRAAGMALYVGLLLLAGWVLALQQGAEAFAAYTSALSTPIGLAIVFAVILAWLFHLANGVRHLFWDVGAGFKPATANLTAWLAIVFAALGTTAIVVGLIANGRI